MFSCYDGTWAWYDDFAGGLYIVGTVEGHNCLAGIWPAQEQSTEELFTSQGDFDMPLFDAFFSLNNLKVSTRGTGYRNQDGYVKPYCIVPYRGRRSLLFY